MFVILHILAQITDILRPMMNFPFPELSMMALLSLAKARPPSLRAFSNASSLKFRKAPDTFKVATAPASYRMENPEIPKIGEK